MEPLPPPTFEEFMANLDPKLREAIERGFQILDISYTPRYAQFVVQPLFSDINRSLLAVKEQLEPSGRVPFVQKKDNQLVLFIGMLRPREFQEDPIYARDPEKAFMPPKTRRSLISPILLMITIGTTFFSGYTNSLGFIGEEELIFSWRAVGMSILFSFALMSILGLHELGHYITSRRSGIDATLPYFIPAIPPIGTFGAFIQIKSPILDRNTLLRIGFNGPITSFVIAFVTLIVGIQLSEFSEVTDGDGGMYLGASILFERLVLWIKDPVPNDMVLHLHPLAFAGWVGLLITSINLMPIGQLDGGHISRAILGPIWAKRMSMVSFMALIALGLGLNYEGWWLWAFLVYMLGGGRGAHPLNDVTRVDNKHFGLGIIAIFIFILSFIPVPFSLM